MKIGKQMLWIGVAMCLVQPALAAVDTITALGTQLGATIGATVKIITSGSYVAGIAFILGAIMKFKQHKDNPTQIPIGTPISLLFIGAALLFFPVILTMAGKSIFGTTTTAGSAGTAWGAGGSS